MYKVKWKNFNENECSKNKNIIFYFLLAWERESNL